MKVAIMQPYFLPYVGYFQLIGAVDLFIVYDNIKYTKKGWINRNRLLRNGKGAVFSLPLKSGSDSLDVRDRELATTFNPQRLLNEIDGAYRRAPYFAQTFPLVRKILGYDDRNLFRFIHHSLILVCEHLGITTRHRVSSDIPVDGGLKGQDRVLALCEAVGANTYVNAIGGVELYDGGEFRRHGIDLRFIKADPLGYQQFGSEFVPCLSIVDVLMFNQRDAIREYVGSGYKLIPA